MSTESSTTAGRDWAAYYAPLLAVYQDARASGHARSAALAQIVEGAGSLVHKMAAGNLPGGRAHPDYFDACQEMLLCVVEMAGAYEPRRAIPFNKWLTAHTSRLRFTLLSFTRDEGDKKDLNMLSRSNAARERLSAGGRDTPTLAELGAEVLREARESRTADLLAAHPGLEADVLDARVERWLSRQSIKAGVARLCSGSLNTPKHVSLQAYCESADGTQTTAADKNLVSPAADAALDEGEDDTAAADLLALATLGLGAREATATRAVLAAAQAGDSPGTGNESASRSILSAVAGRVASPHAQYAQYAAGLESQFRSVRERAGCGTIDDGVLAQIQQLATV